MSWRPVLAHAVMLRHDPVRDTDLLLMPERVVVLRGHAGSVVRLCDGGARCPRSSPRSPNGSPARR